MSIKTNQKTQNQSNDFESNSDLYESITSSQPASKHNTYLLIGVMLVSLLVGGLFGYWYHSEPTSKTHPKGGIQELKKALEYYHGWRAAMYEKKDIAAKLKDAKTSQAAYDANGKYAKGNKIKAKIDALETKLNVLTKKEKQAEHRYKTALRNDPELAKLLDEYARNNLKNRGKDFLEKVWRNICFWRNEKVT